MTGPRLDELARHSLARDDGPSAGPPAEIDRIALDVRLGDRVEVVTLWARDGTLRGTSTSGAAFTSDASTPVDPYVHAALRWIAGPRSSADAEGPAVRHTRPPRAGATERPPQALPVDPSLPSAIDDLLTAVVRAGVDARDAPSVLEALTRVRSSIAPGALDAARWLGTLERSLARAAVGPVARLLDAASGAIEALRADPGDPRAAWLGGDAALVSRHEATLVELGREWVDGTTPGAIEQRYLLDLDAGDLLCERRVRGEPAPSLGPCPRVVTAGLAEVASNARPRRVQLRHYTVRLGWTESEGARILSLRLPSLEDLIALHHRAASNGAPPCDTIALLGCRAGARGTLESLAGEPLPFARHEAAGALAALPAACADLAPAWALVRVVDEDGGLRLVPCSVGDARTARRLT